MAVKYRDSTLDIAKGIAIVMIVAGHVIRGLGSAGIMNQAAPSFQIVDQLLYTVHLSVFAFVAGFFVKDAVNRDGAARYALDRNQLWLYLYVVWSLIQGIVKLITASLVNTPTSVAGILKIWIPEGQLWYLPFLIVMTTAVALVKPWRSRRVAMFSSGASLIFSLTLWGWSGPWAGTQGLALTVFYVGGAIWGKAAFIRMIHLVSGRVAVAASLGAFASFLLIVLFTNSTPPTTSSDGQSSLSPGLGLTASALGIVAVLATSRALALLGSPFRWLAFLGQRSLEIFLAHIIAASGIRIILVLAGFTQPGLHVVAGILVGVLAPIGLWWLFERLRFPYLFVNPKLSAAKRADDGRSVESNRTTTL